MWGHFAVTVFIVISGYCLALPLARHPERDFSPREFFRKRALRIPPPYYFGLALTLLLILTCVGKKTGTHWDSVLPLTPTGVLSGALLLPDIFPTINHAYWSIGVECKIYLLFPLLVWAWRRCGVTIATAIFTLAAYLLAGLAHGTARASMSPQYLAMFCWGAAAAWVANAPAVGWVRLRYSRVWDLATGVAAIPLIALCTRWGHVPSRMFVLDLFAGAIATAALVIAARTKANPLRRSLSLPVFTGIGEYSYSLYLIHAPLLQVVWQYGAALLFRDPLPRFLATVIGGVPLILLASQIFYRYCERPYVPNLCNFHPKAASNLTGGTGV